MGSLVIVAIPREDDPVWKISSEKVPHLTILFLGENSDHPDKARIFEFLEHAANTTMTRFGLDVERRGTLGDDEADVVFFRKDNRSFPKIKDFRANLLQDNTIRTAFESADQFPEWNPHLTLGYPETPAKNTADDRLYWVQFDRIALWDGDSEGTELLLKDDYSMEVSMSDTTAKGLEFLSHHGIKGMRWGVRRAATSKALSPRQTKRLDKRFERNTRTFNTVLKLHNRAADLTNKNDIDRINNKPAYKGKDFTRDSPLRQKYYAEHQKAFIDNLQKAADEMGTNASGTKKYTILEKPDGSWDVLLDDTKKVKHADEDPMTVKVKYDEQGHILSLAVVSTTMTHGEEFLEHHGVKGMRWGFRKGSGGVSTSRKKAPTSDDFKKAQAARTKIGTSKTGKSAKKTAPLSNEELQSLVKRMNLEKQYAELSARDKKKVVGAKFVGDLIGGTASGIVKGQATRLGNQLAQEQIEKLLKNAKK